MVARKFPRNTGPALARKFPQNPRRSTSVKKIPCNVATLCCEEIPLQSWTSFVARKFPRNTGPAWSQGNSLTELWRGNVIAKLDQHGGKEISSQYWTSLVTRKFPCNTVCNVPLLRAYPVGHFRSEPRTKTAHASDQTCLGLNPHASDQIPMPQTNTPRTNAPCLGAMARNSHGPLRPKRHILVPLCFGTLSLVIIVFIILSLSIVVAYYCLSITIYSPLY